MLTDVLLRVLEVILMGKSGHEGPIYKMKKLKMVINY